MYEKKLIRWGHSLNVRLSCLAGILLLLIGTIIGATLWVTSAQKTDGLVINLAGRQRMLTQSYSKEFLREAHLRQLTSAAEQFAAGVSRRAAAGRAYYTANVIRKLQSQWPDFKEDAYYRQIEKALPLPATFAREVFESSDQENGYQYELLSKWNINDTHGLRDGFEQRAWQSLNRNAHTPYQEYLPVGQGVELRYATADVASDISCVSCHNNHPSSSKKDFKLHDLMGIQVVSVAITQDPVLADTLLNGDHASRQRTSEKVRNLFETTLSALNNGGTTYVDLAMTEPIAVPVSTNSRIQKKLTDLDDLWKQLLQAALGMEIEEVHSAAYQKYLGQFDKLNMACLEKANEVVKMYQTDSETTVARLTTIHYAAGIIALVVFIVFLGAARSITDRRRAETMLRLQSSALESAANAIMITNRKGCIVWVNPGFTHLTGYALDEVMGKNPHFLKSGVYNDAVYPNLWETVLSGQVWHGEIVNQHKDGRCYTEEMTITPVLDQHGKVGHFITVKQDITERKQQEEELAQAKANAEAANRAKSEFLANMSHEIRTPMTAILGFSEVLMESGINQEQLDATTTIKQNGEYLIKLINDILDLSKIEAGKLEVELIQCSPSQILSEVVSLMHVRANSKNLSLQIEYDGPIPQTIQSDPTRLRQILVNLIGNAIKFTEAGKIRLVARLLDAETDDPKIQFEVIDSGIGLTEKQIANLFKPFHQADASTTRKFGGTGLGLTISKRLAGKLGGDIAVESTFGEGSTFTVTISTDRLYGVSLLTSLTEVQLATNFAKNPDVAKIKLNCRVLLAEDGPDNQRLITFLLKKAGAVVTLAENGKIAHDLALAARDEGLPFDVILMDMQMPVMDGYDATSKLREAEYIGPIVALTAHAMSTDRDKCLNAGCDDYLTKPIDKEKLISLVADYASRQELRKSSSVTVA